MLITSGDGGFTQIFKTSLMTWLLELIENDFFTQCAKNTHKNDHHNISARKADRDGVYVEGRVCVRERERERERERVRESGKKQR